MSDVDRSPGGTGPHLPARLRSISTPDPPDPPPPPDSADEAQIERLKVENDSIRAKNENTRAETKKLEEEAQAEIEIRRAESKAQIAGLETDRKNRQVERYAGTATFIFGVIVAACLAVATAGEESLAYHFTPGTGLLIAAGGLRLRALPLNKRALIWWGEDEQGVSKGEGER